MSRFARHFFVCTNSRPPGGKPSCDERGSRDLVAALQLGLSQHPEIWREVSVTPTGCLGPCFDGPTIVVYPEGTWYRAVTEPDIAEIVREHMVGGRAVERLRYHWPDENA